jgi:hypothetical protein
MCSCDRAQRKPEYSPKGRDIPIASPTGIHVHEVICLETDEDQEITDTNTIKRREEEIRLKTSPQSFSTSTRSETRNDRKNHRRNTFNTFSQGRI